MSEEFRDNIVRPAKRGRSFTSAFGDNYNRRYSPRQAFDAAEGPLRLENGPVGEDYGPVEEIDDEMNDL